ncbi:hypothetical protein [Ensifer adhaerens]|uniref:hypothetical protein n=1 Tax=Ensifer adhaerens TaxID=106592 RepID=UPI0015C3B784|nr:hypothetical protein [Ensifer adhaerens]
MAEPHRGSFPIDATQENLDLVAEGAPLLSAIADWSDEPHHEAVILLLAWNSD